jgi:hypothetical protein
MITTGDQELSPILQSNKNYARERRNLSGTGLAHGAIVALLFLAYMSVWAVSSPPGSAPDDDFHLASIWCANGTTDAGENSCRKVPSGYVVRADVARVPCFARKPIVSGGCIRSDAEGVTTNRVNDGNYPVLYYKTMNLFVGGDIGETVLRIRLVNAFIAALLLGAAIWLAGPKLRRAVALSSLVTVVPLTSFFVPSTNPSSWTIAGLGTYWAFLITLLTGDKGMRRRLSASFCVLSAVLTIGSRGDGAAFLVLVTAAVLVMVAEPRRVSALQLLIPLYLSALALFVFLTAGQSKSIGGLGQTVGATGHGASLFVSNVFSYPILLSGVWGVGWGLGWFDTFIHPSVGAMTWGCAFAAVSLAARNYDRRKSASVLIVASAIIIVPLVVLQGGGNFVGDQVQPRYLLPIVIAGLGLALFAREDRTWPCGRAPLTMMAFTVSFANAVALHTNLRRYVTGLDVHSLNLNFRFEWWWPSLGTPMDIWFLGLVSGAALFSALAWASHIDAQLDAETGANLSQGLPKEPLFESALSASPVRNS